MQAVKILLVLLFVAIIAAGLVAFRPGQSWRDLEMSCIKISDLNIEDGRIGVTFSPANKENGRIRKVFDAQNGLEIVGAEVLPRYGPVVGSNGTHNAVIACGFQEGVPLCAFNLTDVNSAPSITLLKHLGLTSRGDFNGRYLVFSAWEPEYNISALFKVYLIDLFVNRAIVLADSFARRDETVVDGYVVGWTEFNLTHGSIVLEDLLNGRRQTVSTAGQELLRLDIASDWAVWEAPNPEAVNATSSQIQLFNFASGTVSNLTGRNEPVSSPVTDGKYVAWIQEQGECDRLQVRVLPA